MKRIITIGIVIIGVIVLMASCGDKQKESTAAKNEIKESPSKAVSTKSADKEEAVSMSPQQKLGKRLFIMCEACHNVEKGAPHKVGPNLHKIFGRKAGTETGFIYSDAVVNSDIVWSDETIRSWLKNPNDYIPGTNMVFVGLKKEHQQDALLSYLHLVTE